jgi:hypothetical protein
MVTMSLKHLAAAACALSALAVPASALAAPGSGTVLPPDSPTSSAPCATMAATPPVQRANRKAAVDLKYNISNCSDTDETVSVSVAGSFESIGADGLPVTCPVAGWDAGTLTLRPHETKSIVSQVPSSRCQLGVDGATVTFEATASNVADGSVLATETSLLLITLAF